MTQIEFNKRLCSLQSSLYRFAFSLTTDHNDADDLLQETIFKAIRYKDNFKDETNLRSWTFTIMKNTFINNYRKNIRIGRSLDTNKDLTMLKIPFEQGSMSPDSYYSEREIRKAIAMLPDDYKVPFNMHTEGYKYKEIAEKLNLPIGSVKSRIFIARRKLMAALADYA
ncbi:MAG: RNA polymerase sigma factor [Salinivirgaceae bacterium]|nr:RNA polymerase sigma factor [Salinivirgaceae bacterium]MDY0279993.1 RNA polymerase sigma factor [Salinivirgaceae bacterium]